VGTLSVEVALTPLLHHTVRIDHAIAEDVVVTDPQRPFSPPPKQPDTEPSEPSAWSIAAPDLQLHRVTVALTGKQTMTIEQLELTATAAIPAGGEIVGDIKQLHGRWKERGL